MKKSWIAFITFITIGLTLNGCSQEKVMDTEFIRLQNKVKDIETNLKQKEDETAVLQQKVSDLEEQLKQQKEQIQLLASHFEKDEWLEMHPISIQDVKITSENMDASGRIYGPFNLNVTLYNGTDRDMKDKLIAIVMRDSEPWKDSQPNLQNLIQPFEIKGKESKTISFSNIPVDAPSSRLNIIVKLMEKATSSTPANVVPGKATWVVVPTVTDPPHN